MSDEIRSAVKRLNEAWRAGQFAELTQFFHPDVVLAHPRFTQRTVGRDALIASYVDFVSHATIDAFETTEPSVDVANDVAISVSPWRMKYRFENNPYDESGWDILVWNRLASGWVIVWRTVVLK